VGDAQDGIAIGLNCAAECLSSQSRLCPVNSGVQNLPMVDFPELVELGKVLQLFAAKRGGVYGFVGLASLKRW